MEQGGGTTMQPKMPSDADDERDKNNLIIIF
jgi:hypothetical protein